MDIVRSLIGLVFLILVGYVFSTNRKSINWKTVITGIALQIIFALLILKVSLIRQGFQFAANFFVAVIGFTREGTKFLFGNLVTDTGTFGFIFAFQVLPTVIFFSALTSFLYYLGILQKIVYAFAWVMNKTMRLSGAESLSAAGNIFLGQTESPLLIRPFLPSLTRSEMLCVMVGGMATIAGGVLAAYVGFLGGPDIAQQQFFAMHLLSASIMSAPAAIAASKLLLPETEQEKIITKLELNEEKIGGNMLEALANGTTDGLKLAMNVGAMLLAFIAFIYMFNSLFLLIGDWTGLNTIIQNYTNGKFEGLTLSYFFGNIFAPVAWLLGVPSNDIVAVGQLLGEKTILNEFVAYASLGTMKEAGTILNQKSVIIATYALCGFSNFASIGIQIGGIGSLAPNQKRQLSELGIRALLGGTIACLMTAVIAGMLIS